MLCVHVNVNADTRYACLGIITCRAQDTIGGTNPATATIITFARFPIRRRYATRLAIGFTKTDTRCTDTYESTAHESISTKV
jgi:hypothetical protein